MVNLRFFLGNTEKSKEWKDRVWGTDFGDLRWGSLSEQLSSARALGHSKRDSGGQSKIEKIGATSWDSNVL